VGRRGWLHSEEVEVKAEVEAGVRAEIEGKGLPLFIY
jgi:hypothetical protein